MRKAAVRFAAVACTGRPDAKWPAACYRLRTSNEGPLSLHDEIDAFFAEAGPLARLLPGYAPRAAQIEMAHLVLDTVQGRAPGAPKRLAVEAGTGTGKSLAYLAAALLSDERVLVSTGTKALQDQLFFKDVPLAAACVSALRGKPMAADDVVLVKGRQNYLCKLRFERFAMQPTFAFSHEATLFDALVQFDKTTKTGDRAELTILPDSYATWNDLDAKSETCLGTRCSHYEACHVVTLKRRAEGAKLVVANHHLLCADLRVRLESAAEADGDSQALASVLPKASFVIVDEAHALPDVASGYFAVSVERPAFERFVFDVRKLADGLSGDDRAAVLDAQLGTEEQMQRLFAQLQPLVEGERGRTKLPPGAHALHSGLVQRLLDVRERLAAARIDNTDEDGPLRMAERDGLVRRAEKHAQELAFVFEQAPADAAFVVTLETGARAPVVQATPVDVAKALERTFFRQEGALVLTSATLAVAQDLTPFLERVGGIVDTTAADAKPGDRKAGATAGAAGGWSTRVLPSPFAFEKQAALYSPKDMPEPSHPAYTTRFFEEARFLLELSRGGALFLFTSHRAMQEGAATLRPFCEEHGMRVLLQGDAPKAVLLETLRQSAGNVGAVLFATHSFWEGIDVQGKALRLVAIDRLPFGVPTDPLRKARNDLCAARGGDPFLDISVPEAALLLKQGAGRLIRTTTDTGVVAVLDGRLRSRPYGRTFLATLPPFLRIGSARALAAFWSRFVVPGSEGQPLAP